MDSPLPESQSSPSGSKQKLWSVGTLTYTTTGLVVLFAWLLWGDFAWSMKDRSVGPVVQLLLKKFSASDLLMGLLLASLPAAIGLFLGPIVSYKSDRLRSRWGRRIPYILITTPLTTLTMFGLAAGPWLGEQLHHFLGSSSPGLNACVLGTIGFCWVLFEFATITANAVFGALINDVVPQEIMGRFFGLFRVFSLIAGMVFNKLVIGHANDYYSWIFIGMGLLYGVGVTLMCLRVKEGGYPPPPVAEEVHGKRKGFLPALKTYFHECFGHAYYLWFFGGIAFATISLSPVNLYSIPYRESVNMSLQAYGDSLFLSYFISLLLAYPLGAIADRIHPLRLTMIALALYAATAIWGGFFAQNADNFRAAFIGHTVISGIFFTASASLPQRLLPRSRFAELVSASGIIISLLNIGFPAILGVFLDWTHHNYRHTFFIGATFSLLGLVFLFVLYRKFMALGGPTGYVAPEDEGYNERAPAAK